MNKYFLPFNNQVLCILAQSIQEALEPWHRVNSLKRYSESEFEKLLLEDFNGKDYLLLTGRSVTKQEILNYPMNKKNSIGNVNIINEFKKSNKEIPTIPDLVVEKGTELPENKTLDKIPLENYFE